MTDKQDVCDDLNACREQARGDLQAAFRRLLGVVGQMAGLHDDGEAFWVDDDDIEECGDGGDGANRKQRRVGLLAILALLLTLPAGCRCPDRWFLTLHCEEGIRTVECASRENCRALADAVLSVDGPCNSASIGHRETCEEEP